MCLGKGGHQTVEPGTWKRHTAPATELMFTAWLPYGCSGPVGTLWPKRPLVQAGLQGGVKNHLSLQPNHGELKTLADVRRMPSCWVGCASQLCPQGMCFRIWRPCRDTNSPCLLLLLEDVCCWLNPVAACRGKIFWCSSAAQLSGI